MVLGSMTRLRPDSLERFFFQDNSTFIYFCALGTHLNPQLHVYSTIRSQTFSFSFPVCGLSCQVFLPLPLTVVYVVDLYKTRHSDTSPSSLPYSWCLLLSSACELIGVVPPQLPLQPFTSCPGYGYRITAPVLAWSYHLTQSLILPHIIFSVFLVRRYAVSLFSRRDPGLIPPYP